MVTYRKVLDYILAEPFRPFRIKLASGQAFEIRYPELIYVGIKSIELYAAASNHEDEKWHRVSLAQVEAVEPLDAATAMSN